MNQKSINLKDLETKEKALEKEYNELEDIKNKATIRQLEIQGKIKLIAEMKLSLKEDGKTKTQKGQKN